MILRSLKKSFFLARIAREEQRHSLDLQMARREGRLTDWLFEHVSGRDEPRIRELADLCRNDRAWRTVLQSHSATPSQLVEISKSLRQAGADVIVKGHFIPISALAFPSTLDYSLGQCDSSGEMTADAANRVADRLIRYFHNGEVGQIRAA